MINRATLQGRFKSAQKLLFAIQQHQPKPSTASQPPFSQHQALNETIRLLASYPQASHDMAAMFKQRFRRWTDNCQLLLSTLDRDDKNAKALYALLRILTGEKAALREHATQWRDEFMGSLLFAYPTMTVNELGSLLFFFCFFWILNERKN